MLRPPSSLMKLMRWEVRGVVDQEIMKQACGLSSLVSWSFLWFRCNCEAEREEFLLEMTRSKRQPRVWGNRWIGDETSQSQRERARTKWWTRRSWSQLFLLFFFFLWFLCSPRSRTGRQRDGKDGYPDPRSWSECSVCVFLCFQFLWSFSLQGEKTEEGTWGLLFETARCSVSTTIFLVSSSALLFSFSLFSCLFLLFLSVSLHNCCRGWMGVTMMLIQITPKWVSLFSLCFSTSAWSSFVLSSFMLLHSILLISFPAQLLQEMDGCNSDVDPDNPKWVSLLSFVFPLLLASFCSFFLLRCFLLSVCPVSRHNCCKRWMDVTAMLIQITPNGCLSWPPPICLGLSMKPSEGDWRKEFVYSKQHEGWEWWMIMMIWVCTSLVGCCWSLFSFASLLFLLLGLVLFCSLFIGCLLISFGTCWFLIYIYAFHLFPVYCIWSWFPFASLLFPSSSFTPRHHC